MSAVLSAALHIKSKESMLKCFCHLLTAIQQTKISLRPANTVIADYL